MKKIWIMLRKHWAEDFNFKAYLSLTLFLAVSILLNYYFDFEDSYVDQVTTLWRIPAKSLFFLFPYLTASFITLYFYNKLHILKSARYWVQVLFIIICMSFDSAFPIYEWMIKDNFTYQVHLWLTKFIRGVINIPLIFIPAYIFYKFRNDQNHFYGMTKGFDPKPYLQLLLVMLPLLLIASFMENFNSFYPMYKFSNADGYWNISEGWLIAGYELAYGWNFLSVEFIFRGFLVIGMAKILGRQAILPMVVLYCFYHFGKPEGEAISSIFGGYILGVIAYETRSIFGGVLIHIGIAWIMEALGFWQNNYI
ncbi:MAG: CPBP family intramembrane glutamic endopeptidase [Candidatus Cyclobacteriaceae bacterium M2_1C_046]